MTNRVVVSMGILGAGIAGLVLAANIGSLEAAPVVQPIQALLVNPPGNPANVRVQEPVRIAEPGTAFQFQKTEVGSGGRVGFTVGEPAGLFRVENVNGLITSAPGQPILAVVRVVSSFETGGLVHFKYLPLQLVAFTDGNDHYTFNADLGLYALAGGRIELTVETIGAATGSVSARITVSGRQELP